MNAAVFLYCLHHVKRLSILSKAVHCLHSRKMMNYHRRRLECLSKARYEPLAAF